MRAALTAILCAAVLLLGAPWASADEPQLRTARAARLVAMGRALDAAGDPGSAAGYFRDAIRIDPRHAAAYAELGKVYLDRGSVGDALEVLEAGQRARPHDNRLARLKARALLARGDPRAALATLRTLTDRNPGDLEAHKARARLARDTGAWAESLVSYRAMVDLAARGAAVRREDLTEARMSARALAQLLGTLDPVAGGCTRASRLRRALAGCLETSQRRR